MGAAVGRPGLCGRRRAEEPGLTARDCRTPHLRRKPQPVAYEGRAEAGAEYDGDSRDACVLRPLQAAACAYRIGVAPRACHKVLVVRGGMPRQLDCNQMLCADNNGFSLHAALRCAADDRQALEQLCRYTSPARHWPTNACNQHRRAGGAEAQDHTARRHYAIDDVAAGVHATAH